ncbi:MAG: FecR domain-containing protein [Gammaproteobacteria bacterium]|nr:FecR domain-containing protein [Gammaproteobacteria bacterium]
MPAVSKRFISLGSLTFFIAFSLASWCAPVEGAIKPVGKVILTNGTFLAIQADSSSRSLTRGSEFYQGDRLWTGPTTKAQIRFSDGAIMTLRADTEFRVDEYEFDNKNANRNKSLFTLIKGGFRTITGLVSRLKPESYRVKTSYAVVGVRGTTFETLIDSGLYVAAWQGKVSIENEAGKILLGFDEDTNFARVTGFTRSPTGLLVTPPQLLESVDPGLQEGGLNSTETDLLAGYLRQGNDVRLSASEVGGLNRVGAAVVSGPGGQPPVGGLATTGIAGSPVFLDLGRNEVVRQGGASAPLPVNLNLFGSEINLGSWSAAAHVQDNPHDPGDINALAQSVFWISMEQPITLPTGSTSFTTPIAFQGVSNAGAVSFPTVFNVGVDFGASTLTGNMQFAAGTPVQNWDANFAGTVGGPTFQAKVNPGTSTVNGNSIIGDLNGGFSGNNGELIGGVFDLEQASNSGVHVEGTFLSQ